MGKASSLILTLQTAVYFALLFLGCYFIYTSQVIQRYNIQRRDFFEYSEPLTELPTILTYTVPYNLSFGEDFNISYGIRGSDAKNLSLGINNIGGSLHVDFQRVYDLSVFKITPLNFSGDIPLDYNLTYIFAPQVIRSIQTIQVGTRVSTENNSIAVTSTFRDGDGDELLSKVGWLMQVNQIKAQKIIHNQDIQKCRSLPYNHLILRKVASDIRNCSFPCIPSYINKKQSDSYFHKIPTCESEEDKRCFREKRDMADAMFLKDEGLTKPCTIVQYKYQQHSLKINPIDGSPIPKHVAWFNFIFLHHQK